MPESRHDQAPLTPTPQSFISREMHVLLTLTICIYATTWLLTYGSWYLPDYELLGEFYDHQAVSLILGRMDVPFEAIGFEAFTREEKHYGYFGITPALLRLPLTILFPDMFGRWARVSMLAGYIVTLIYGLMILRSIRESVTGNREPENGAARLLEVMHLLLIGTGTALFLASRSYVYHEALMWGSAFAVMSIAHLIRYVRTHQLSQLVVAGIAAIAAVNSRPTVGMGPLFILGLMGLASLPIQLRLFKALLEVLGIGQTQPGWGRVVAGSGLATTGLALMMAVNYAKFETLTSLPLHLHHEYNAERLAKTRGGQFMTLRSVRTTAHNYFHPSRIRVVPQFPYVYMTRHNYRYPEVGLDLIEWYVGFPAWTPAFAVLTLGGIGLCFTRPFRIARLPLIGGSVSLLMILMAACLTHRYQHDFTPLLLVGSSVCIVWLSTIPRRAAIGAGVLLPFVLYSALAGCAIALQYQRWIVWGVDEKERVEFQNWRRAIDSWFGVDTNEFNINEPGVKLARDDDVNSTEA